MTLTLLLLTACPILAGPAPLVLRNDSALRELTFDGQVWRTTRIARADGKDALAVHSDEFHLLYLDDREADIGAYQVDGEPVWQGKERLSLRYRPRAGADLPPVTLTYWVGPGATLRKTVTLETKPGTSLDRLEVERFVTQSPAARGGRGEPVYLDGRWFCGLEYPAGHTRHTDGNTPAADAHHYEKVGNYSIVDLDGRDRLKTPVPGMVRLMHFPGDAPADGRLVSKTAVFGIGRPAQPIELAFGDYLRTVAKPDRSFAHYNNWFDGSGKSLRGDAFVKVWRAFKQRLEPAGLRLEAMVPDNGWQNGSSLWEPGGDFPGGMADLAKLGRALHDEGSGLGLWLSLDGTSNNIGWGEQHGYARAKANAYFSQYFAHYSLSQPKYRADMEAQLRRLVRECGLTYFKHDFNHLSDIGPGNGHPATDRHGHEANVDAMIALLAACRAENPAIYQNLTNWMWFSPWWLMHGDALWMLAGDDGFNRNQPELSSRAMATTDRDTYLWRMWGDPADRPLVPISRLMTHGIIRNPGGQMESPQDTLADWADHVWMHYGRGTQLKEWYITPAAMDDAHWQVLLDVHRWSQRNFRALCNTVFVGGRPDEGHVYGYLGWDGDHGVLVARNPAVAEQTLAAPFDAVTLYRGKPGQPFCAKQVYPQAGAWPTPFRSGQPLAVTIPGYTTIVLELDRGAATKANAPELSLPRVSAQSVTLPDEAMARCDLLVVGYDELPIVTLDGQPATPTRSSEGGVNQFAGYARSGMPSATARMWRMAGFDLRAHRGQSVALGFSGETRAEAWLLLDRTLVAKTVRQTLRVLPETKLQAPPPRAITDAEWAARRAARLRLDTFGLEPWAGGKASVELNGQVVGELTDPKSGDSWHTQTLDLPLDRVLRANKLAVLREKDGDKWKLRRATLEVQLADGTWVPSNVGAPQTSHGDWAYLEGETFESPTRTRVMALAFR